MSLRSMLASFAIAALAASAALAHDVTVGSLTLTDLWTRATPPKAQTGGGYLTITNNGDQPDRLIAVSTGIAGLAEIHEMKVENGIMTMRPIDGGLEIPAHGTVTLAPGGYHLMFMKLSGPVALADGKLPVTLTFERAGPVDTFLHVMPIGSPGLSGGAGHDMSGMKPGAH